MSFLNKEQIIDDVVSKMTEEDKQELATLQYEDMIKFHHGVGTFIRNEYKLWERNNPLTALWVIDNESGNEKFIIDGVDHHPCHPDAVSMDILYGIYEKVIGKTSDKTPEQIRNEIMNNVKLEIVQGKKGK